MALLASMATLLSTSVQQVAAYGQSTFTLPLSPNTIQHATNQRNQAAALRHIHKGFSLEPRNQKNVQSFTTAFFPFRWFCLVPETTKDRRTDAWIIFFLVLVFRVSLVEETVEFNFVR